MVKEARREYFSKHPCNFITDGNCDLSGMFKCLATSTGLLGTSIYETQSPWTGPEELKTSKLCSAIPTQGFEVSPGSTPLRIS